MAERAGLLNRYTSLNLYRGFESLPLRQTVWSPEKSARISLEIAENGLNFATLALKLEEKVFFRMLHASFAAFFSVRRSSSPVSQITQSNAMRSQADHMAKAT